jgi:hypothetical protein
MDYKTQKSLFGVVATPMGQSFAVPNEAEKAGVEYAKKWIDDGKPELGQ